MNPPMQYSGTGMALTERAEGCQLVAYRDSGGVWTIGYGHTTGVYEGMTCTMAEAAQWLFADMQTAVDAVNRLVTVQLTQGEFDALVDFAYNEGQGRLAGSTMLKLLNA